MRWPFKSMWKSLSAHMRLRHRVQERQARHRLVGDLGVDPDHLRVLEALDEGEHVPDRRQEDVAARLVRLWLERDTHVIALLAHVFAEEVERLAEALERVARRLCGVGLDTLATSPEDVEGRADLGAQVDAPHDLLERVTTHLAVVGGERTVLEDRMGEEVRGGHRDLHAGLVERLRELALDALALGLVRAGRQQVVVVEADAVGARSRPACGRYRRGEGRAGSRRRRGRCPCGRPSRGRR